MGCGVVTEQIHDWILLETSLQQHNCKYFFSFRSWTMIVVNPWSHLCQAVSLERHCKFTSKVYVPVKPSVKWRKSRLVLVFFHCLLKTFNLWWLQEEEQTSDMTTGLRAVEWHHSHKTHGFDWLSSFPPPQFLFKICMRFFKQVPKLTGTNQLAQLNTQVKCFIFTYSAHLKTWAVHRLSSQDTQFSSFSLLFTS